MLKLSLTLLLCSLSFTAIASDQNQKLFDAIKDNNLKRAVKALKKGASPSAVNNPDAPTTTAFLRAAALNRVDIIHAMFSYGAKVNEQRPIDHHTALMIAATNDFDFLAKHLIERKADLNLSTIFNRTALQIAALNNSLRVARMLVVQPTIDVNNRPGLCALAVAARQGHKEMVVLIKNLTGEKAPVTECLLSAIDKAEYNGHHEIVELLKQP